MKEQQPSSGCTITLWFLLGIQIAAFVAVTVYHAGKIRDLETRPSNYADVMRDLVNELEKLSHESDVSRRKREVNPVIAELSDQLKRAQPAAQCNVSCAHDVVSLLKAYVNFNNNLPNKRQSEKRQTGTGNNLGDLFRELTEIEIHKLEQYCKDNNKICLPGAKGEPGVAGPSGVGGAPGPKGSKGQTGAAGIAGAAGQKGVTGGRGVKGDTESRGLMGPAGPAGPKGERGIMSPPGPRGPKGAMGVQGIKGDRGFEVGINNVDFVLL
ncbi:collectin-12-like [Gigantopelta aegis]|uniref:collectin-12-like n=1 Tax=Gigantopelta aegis TaxID=1735272 RepID=UPI001B889CDA|nr:collectin-12-like [Gigantopelta aegis]